MADYQFASLEKARRPAPTAEQSEHTPGRAPHPIARLQSQAGNRAVARLVQREAFTGDLQARHDLSIRRESEGGELEEEELQAKHDLSVRRESEGGELEEEELQATHDLSVRRESEGGELEEEELQAKHDLSIRRESEGGELEEEELQAKHDLSIRRESEGGELEEEELQAKHDLSIRRESEGGELEEEELQAKHDTTPVIGLEGGPVGDGIQERVNAARGGGSAPPPGMIQKMEAATGANLSAVRVHQGSEADTLNRQLTAKAFTTGNDIFLRADQSTSDSHLMAHELAHVVQQSSGRASSGGGMSVGAANDPLEHDADNLANRVLSGAALREADETRA